MSARIKWALGGSGALAALVGLVLWQQTQPPAFTFTLIDGREQTLAALRGRPVLLTFWSPTCGPCVEEMPDLIALYQELHGRGLELIAVSQPYDPPGHVVELGKRLPYPVALDLEGRAQRTFDVAAIPRTLLFGPDGRVVMDRTGKMEMTSLRSTILELMQPS